MTYKNQAIGESLMWWFRDEFWLHKSFQKIENCFHNGTDKIFSEKVISVFLNRYSVRRTIEGGRRSEELFTNELVSTNFVQSVKNSEIDKLEHYASKFQSSAKSSVKSALSKFATLYNPDHYIMYDSRSRRGMYRLRSLISKGANEKITYSKIDNYSRYVQYAKELSKKYDDETLKRILFQLEESNIKSFLLNNINAFKLRIVDKWLWLEGYSDEKPFKTNEIQYIEILNSER